MTYDELVKANKTIKTTNIKGKEYAEVNQRIKVFRMLYPNGSIITDIVKLEDGMVVMRAQIVDNVAESGAAVVLATGTAYERERGAINSTSFIENCETSAVGRALGMLGIGIDTSVASADEVANAIAQQTTAQEKQPEQTEKPKEFADDAKIAALMAACQQHGVDVEKILKLYKVGSFAELTVVKWKHAMDNIERIKGMDV